MPEQLASIQQQTRLPDELVVLDDRSTDRTVGMVREFAASVSFPIRIFENERNLGSAANFERAIRLCSGDLIALSDQDDEWCATRLERSARELQDHPSAGLVFSDGDVVDDQGRSLGTTLWQSYDFVGELHRRLLAGDYSVLVRHRFVTGATVMFRGRLREQCLPVAPGWHHDEWVVATVAAVADVRPINEPLIRYRKHSVQQVGLGPKPGFVARKKTHWRELSRQIGTLQEICARLAGMPLSERGKSLFAHYQEHLRFARFRSTLPSHRIERLPAVLRQYAAYTECGTGLLSMATDLVLSK